jgi:hypothetical protein
MMVLYTTKFDMDEQEATLLERFFSHDELEATKVVFIPSTSRTKGV